MNGRTWTEAERETVRQHFATHTALQLAAMLPGRSVTMIYQTAHKMGLRKAADRWPQSFVDAIEDMNRAGMTDAEIARQFGMPRDQVHAVRYARLKLPSRCVGAKLKEVQQRAVATQYARLGIKAAGDLRAWAHAKYARECGWPDDLPPRAVQILNVLAAAGPRTVKQLAADIGLPAKTQAHRIPLRWNNGPGGKAKSRGQGGTYTAALARRGLVIRVRRYIARNSRGVQQANLYLLGPTAIALLEERAREQSQRPEAG